MQVHSAESSSRRRSSSATLGTRKGLGRDSERGRDYANDRMLDSNSKAPGQGQGRYSLPPSFSSSSSSSSSIASLRAPIHPPMPTPTSPPPHQPRKAALKVVGLREKTIPYPVHLADHNSASGRQQVLGLQTLCRRDELSEADEARRRKASSSSSSSSSSSPSPRRAPRSESRKRDGEESNAVSSAPRPAKTSRVSGGAVPLSGGGGRSRDSTSRSPVRRSSFGIGGPIKELPAWPFPMNGGGGSGAGSVERRRGRESSSGPNPNSFASRDSRGQGPTPRMSSSRSLLTPFPPSTTSSPLRPHSTGGASAGNSSDVHHGTAVIKGNASNGANMSIFRGSKFRMEKVSKPVKQKIKSTTFGSGRDLPATSFLR